MSPLPPWSRSGCIPPPLGLRRWFGCPLPLPSVASWRRCHPPVRALGPSAGRYRALPAPPPRLPLACLSPQDCQFNLHPSPFLSAPSRGGSSSSSRSPSPEAAAAAVAGEPMAYSQGGGKKKVCYYYDGERLGWREGSGQGCGAGPRAARGSAAAVASGPRCEGSGQKEGPMFGRILTHSRPGAVQESRPGAKWTPHFSLLAVFLRQSGLPPAYQASCWCEADGSPARLSRPPLVGAEVWGCSAPAPCTHPSPRVKTASPAQTPHKARRPRELRPSRPHPSPPAPIPPYLSLPSVPGWPEKGCPLLRAGLSPDPSTRVGSGE